VNQAQVLLGRINAAHGLKGWVKVYSYTDPIEQILSYSPWTLRRQSVEEDVEVVEARKQGKGIVVRLAGAEDRDQAEALIGNEIWVAGLPDLVDGEYYWHQLQGLTVANTADEILGAVDQMVETGANDVMVVAPNEASIDNQERLIPFVEGKIVREVDFQNEKIIVAWQADY
jgi:16S rRNA processing protein RimM